MEVSLGAVIGAASAGVLLLLLAGWLVLQRRAATRRLAAVATRLEHLGSPIEERGGFERTIARLERAADERLLREDAATDVAARLAAACEHVDHGVIVWDEHGEDVFVNATAATLEGARHGEALARQALDDLRKVALGGEARTQTLELFGPPRRTLVISVAPLDDGHRSLGGVAIVEDVSERRRMEAIRRDFVANIGHELKTPVGALGLLAETIAGERDVAVIARLSERLHAEALRVGRIIEDLLSLSRIEAEEKPLREPVPVHLVVAQSVERVRTFAAQRGIALEVDDPPRRLTVLGDRRQLVSAIYNLLENAVKYSESGSTVEVTVATVDEVVEVVVRDHGIGIPHRDLERIFERFYRVDRARARDTGGTGLGLAIVRHVVANHGGEILVDSGEGQGSVFTLRLPMGPRAVTVSAKAG